MLILERYKDDGRNTICVRNRKTGQVMRIKVLRIDPKTVRLGLIDDANNFELVREEVSRGFENE